MSWKSFRRNLNSCLGFSIGINFHDNIHESRSSRLRDELPISFDEVTYVNKVNRVFSLKLSNQVKCLYSPIHVVGVVHNINNFFLMWGNACTIGKKRNDKKIHNMFWPWDTQTKSERKLEHKRKKKLRRIQWLPRDVHEMVALGDREKRFWECWWQVVHLNN